MVAKHKKFKIIIIVGAMITFLITCLFINHLVSIHDNEIFFARIDADYANLDQSLGSFPASKVTYQTAQCYYWKKVEFSLTPGPLGCFKSRAYYFSADNYQVALNISKQLSSVATQVFENIQDQHFSMQAPRFMSAQTFSIDDVASDYPSIPGACDIKIDYPASSVQSFSLPTGPKGKPLELTISCGGNAVKAWYPKVNY